MHGGLDVARRKKLRKSVTLALMERKEGHDRIATDLPINARVAPILADDPYEHGAKITVIRSLRDDPLAAMHNAKQIDESQFVAGRHWQRAYELSEIGGVRAIDPTREAVDGGQIAQITITDSQIKAFGDLKRAIIVLGMEGESLIRDVLALHLTVAQAADKRGLFSEMARKYLGRRFRECLDTLAIEFGYAMPTRSSRIS